MISHYEATYLEHSIENMYLKNGITEPQHITIEKITAALNIWIYPSSQKSKAYESVAGLRSVLLDNRLPLKEQRIEFLHEVSHLLRHAGNQTIMPKAFIELQEADADQFVLYASMPFFMLSRLKLPALYNDALLYLSDIFEVPIYLARKRLNQIMRRNYEGQIRTSIEQQTNTAKGVMSKKIPQICEPTIYAYYDPSFTYEGPSQLIFHLDEITLTQKRELPIPLDGPFKQIEIDELLHFEGVKILQHDIVYFEPGNIKLMLGRISRRYGTGAKTLLLQMKDLEEVINRGRIY
ncbi:ImmA/IrrE family metallo-endopeptidase [Paenibacillus polymyxa]|uniref:ImmA/IrrE family metallo-endopeptidase n=1 Tax=Paenibacillus polymyxa TaxID=1406 RepID=UPI0003D3592E|nr:ImmA/IrrE family metallo-endopeptidase [Paenibacillus polymyxa]